MTFIGIVGLFVTFGLAVTAAPMGYPWWTAVLCGFAMAAAIYGIAH